jgi:zinc and cadmium transporter
LGGAFIHLIPESAEALEASALGLAVLGGLFAFLILERFLHWHHHHHSHAAEGGVEPEEAHTEIKPFGKLILAADGLHNFLDGAVIASAYLISFEAGLVATIAIALHEIPQEIGDFGVLLLAGFRKGKALLANLLSSLSAFVGAGVALLFAESFETLIPVFTAFAAGGFIYIAAADLVPELHKKAGGFRGAIVQVFLVAVGITLMYALTFFEA